MKYFVAADLHGSAYYCRMLLQAYDREKADAILLLGDILYHGPRNDLPREYDTKAVVCMLNPLARHITCVRGNCDAEVDQMVLDFPILSPQISLQLFGHSFLLTHGHHTNIDCLPQYRPEYLLYGHTHVPLNAVRQGVRCLNPGSVSIPKQGSHHGYLTITREGIDWLDLDGACKDHLDW